MENIVSMVSFQKVRRLGWHWSKCGLIFAFFLGRCTYIGSSGWVLPPERVQPSRVDRPLRGHHRGGRPREPPFHRQLSLHQADENNGILPSHQLINQRYSTRRTMRTIHFGFGGKELMANFYHDFISTLKFHLWKQSNSQDQPGFQPNVQGIKGTRWVCMQSKGPN